MPIEIRELHIKVHVKAPAAGDDDTFDFSSITPDQKTIIGGYHPGGVSIAMVDGSVRADDHNPPAGLAAGNGVAIEHLVICHEGLSGFVADDFLLA